MTLVTTETASQIAKPEAVQPEATVLDDEKLLAGLIDKYKDRQGFEGAVAALNSVRDNADTLLDQGGGGRTLVTLMIMSVAMGLSQVTSPETIGEALKPLIVGMMAGITIQIPYEITRRLEQSKARQLINGAIARFHIAHEEGLIGPDAQINQQ